MLRRGFNNTAVGVVVECTMQGAAASRSDAKHVEQTGLSGIVVPPAIGNTAYLLSNIIRLC